VGASAPEISPMTPSPWGLLWGQLVVSQEWYIRLGGHIRADRHSPQFRHEGPSEGCYHHQYVGLSPDEGSVTLGLIRSSVTTAVPNLGGLLRRAGSRVLQANPLTE
jgi:hypothetical protein